MKNGVSSERHSFECPVGHNRALRVSPDLRTSPAALGAFWGD